MATSEANDSQAVDITQLPVEQLAQIHQKLDEEVRLLTVSVEQLKFVQHQFYNSKEQLKKISPLKGDDEILVPLTSTLFVPGRMCDKDRVLVDIGTNFYVEMSTDDASKYFDRRVEFLNKQIESIVPPLAEKSQFKNAVNEILQLKVQARLEEQKKTAPKSKGTGDAK